ncbi:putative S4-like small nucleolar ribonucleoprotein [Hamiltosporidium magnivora]|uniref:Putative S4-like small nucleolar ribonucleoprotein n=1 Tax=Hamiltosporidium magnivora TaxID=148818 RepID=A0A4Q9L507_9MICR|nr:putative S4-like small nucleolar ribonucleoprotein [Hamiltosporidium magnivora]
MRKLKYHEQRLLKKVNFLQWKSTNTTREHILSTKYYLQDREDYNRYNKIVGNIRKLTNSLIRLKETDETRQYLGKLLISRLFSVGLIQNKKLIDCNKIKVSNFCERRLSTLMVRNKMVTSVKDASKFIEHGHVKLGSKIVKDSGILVSKIMDNFISWSESSKIKKSILELENKYDEYE